MTRCSATISVGDALCASRIQDMSENPCGGSVVIGGLRRAICTIDHEALGNLGKKKNHMVLS